MECKDSDEIFRKYRERIAKKRSRIAAITESPDRQFMPKKASKLEAAILEADELMKYKARVLEKKNRKLKRVDHPYKPFCHAIFKGVVLDNNAFFEVLKCGF